MKTIIGTIALSIVSLIVGANGPKYKFQVKEVVWVIKLN
ncbi:hypothetical protein Solca_2675 [Solitalea canadensis DSM 3403]|uniref:Uncharacterized protein n=1 Tax=Solitalea canadensis (strain ATCC 29591 / DSM 3403 / JCM 21819 / LMG 8368 / NBRC 15130 / NCIMB 12057 / USAM 9D) TaxID=929556 RepID=H8KRS1_SOLCM|nr:hypothetical protein Solca_2675 [Solitalea canadensis DSM 3403]